LQFAWQYGNYLNDGKGNLSSREGLTQSAWCHNFDLSKTISSSTLSSSYKDVLAVDLDKIPSKGTNPFKEKCVHSYSRLNELLNKSNRFEHFNISTEGYCLKGNWREERGKSE